MLHVSQGVCLTIARPAASNTIAAGRSRASPDKGSTHESYAANGSTMHGVMLAKANLDIEGGYG
jgi:hypothetical protein